MIRLLTLTAALILSIPTFAGEREAASEDSQPLAIETASIERSFFQPKTLEDINAMVKLDSEFESSLAGEISN